MLVMVLSSSIHSPRNLKELIVYMYIVLSRKICLNFGCDFPLLILLQFEELLFVLTFQHDSDNLLWRLIESMGTNLCRLIVMHEGRIIYQGPREDVLPYFAKLGYSTSNFYRSKLVTIVLFLLW